MHEHLVSIDLWDTLLERSCHPDAVKVFAWQRIALLNGSPVELATPVSLLDNRQLHERSISLRSVNSGHDDEYNLEQVLALAGLDGEASQRQMAFEVAAEKRVTRKSSHSKVWRLIEPKTGVAQIIVSDFYMPAGELKKIIRKAVPEIADLPIIVSCDNLLNKRSGRLFEKIQTGDSWTHIGDNPWSDVEVPKKLGASAIHVKPTIRASLQKSSSTRKWSKRLQGRHPLTSKLDNSETLAIGLIGFSNWVATNFDRSASLVFLEREGITLKKLYDEASKHNVWDIDFPQSSMLAVSRLSTFGPATAVAALETLPRFFRQYPKAGIRELSVALKSETLLGSGVLRDKVGQDLLNGIISDASLLKEVQSELNPSLQVLKDFLQQELGLRRNLALTDLGWAGSIQANLAALAHFDKVFGAYLAHRGPVDHKISVSSFLGFDLGRAFQDLLENVRPIEMLFNQPIGSVVGYRPDGDSISAIRSETIDGHIPQFQEHMISVIGSMEKASNTIAEELLTIGETRQFLAQGLADFVQRPKNKFLQGYLASTHDESFGLGKVVSLGQVHTSRDHSTTGLKSLLFRCRETREMMGWDAAFVYSLFRVNLPLVVRRAVRKMVRLMKKMIH